MTDDLVYTYFLETWESAHTRKFMPPDRLGQYLVHSGRPGKLLIANPFRSWPRTALKRILSKEQTRGQVPTGISIVTPWRMTTINHRVTRDPRPDYRRYDTVLRSCSLKGGLVRPSVITTNPLYAAYGSFEWAESVTYYAWDDWAALPALQQWHDSYKQAYDIIASRGHRVSAVTQAIIDRINPLGDSLILPNGVEPDEWAPPWRAPPWLHKYSRPFITYVGAIHSRLNIEDIADITRHIGGGTIFLVGPVSTPATAAALSAYSNVVIKPSVARQEVAGLLHETNVCIMPHYTTNLTLAMSPLKVYEYCAAGRPSVATALPAVRNIHPSIRLVAPGGSFGEAVLAALSDKPMPESERVEFVSNNSWKRRFETLIAFVLRDV